MSAGGLARSELARRTGVSPDTLRHYERTGVLPCPPRAANGYRRYPHDAVARVTLVRRALSVGFTLAELASVLREREKGGAPCRKVRDLVASRLAAFETRLAALLELRAELGTVLRDWDQTLERTPAGAQARLLDTLAGRPALDGGRGQAGLKPRATRPR